MIPVIAFDPFVHDVGRDRREAHRHDDDEREDSQNPIAHEMRHSPCSTLVIGELETCTRQALWSLPLRVGHAPQPPRPHVEECFYGRTMTACTEFLRPGKPEGLRDHYIALNLSHQALFAEN